MSTAKINTKNLRLRLAQRGILSVAALARQIGCARPTIYFALERPTRYPEVFSKIKGVLGEN